MMVFDHKDRRISVGGSVSTWDFVFRIEPDIAAKQVRWIAEFRAKGTSTGESSDASGTEVVIQN